MSRDDAVAALEAGRIAAERVPMQLGDVMISRTWYFRPKVHIDVPCRVLVAPRAPRLMRFNPQVDETARTFNENYRQFAY